MAFHNTFCEKFSATDVCMVVLKHVKREINKTVVISKYLCGQQFKYIISMTIIKMSLNFTDGLINLSH